MKGNRREWPVREALESVVLMALALIVILLHIPAIKFSEYPILLLDVKLVDFMIRQFEFVEKCTISYKQIAYVLPVWPCMTFMVLAYATIKLRFSFFKLINAFVFGNLMLAVTLLWRAFAVAFFLCHSPENIVSAADRWVILPLILLIYVFSWITAEDWFRFLRSRFFPNITFNKLKPIDRILSKVAYVLILAAVLFFIGHKIVMLTTPKNAEDAFVRTNVNFGDERVIFTMPRSVVLVGVADSPVCKGDLFIGTGVLAAVGVDEECKVLLITAHHVANSIVSLGGKLLLGVMSGSGVERVAVEPRRWFIDDRDMDLTFVDITDAGLQKCAVDCLCMIPQSTPRKGDKVLAICGVPGQEKFEVKPGRYLKNADGYHVLGVKGEPGNSGSPIFHFKDGKASLIGICSKAATGGCDLVLASPMTAAVDMMVKAEKCGYFNPEVRDNVGPDLLRGTELMQRLGIPGGTPVPDARDWTLPKEFNCGNDNYAVVRRERMSYSFKVKDSSNRVIASGNYQACPSENYARIQAFAYACTNKDLTMDEVVGRVKWNWVDESKQIMHILGVSGAHYLINGNLLIVYSDNEPSCSPIMVELARLMEVKTQ